MNQKHAEPTCAEHPRQFQGPYTGKCYLCENKVDAALERAELLRDGHGTAYSVGDVLALAAEVETLRTERDALRGDLRCLLNEPDVAAVLTGYQRDLLTGHLGEA